MKIIIKVEDMLAAVEAIDLVPSRSGIVPSEFIQLHKKNDKLYFSLAAEIYGRTYAKAINSEEGDFKFHVDRLSFVPWILAAKDFKNPQNYELSLLEKKDNKILIVKSGRRKMVLTAITFIKGYPKYAAEEGVTLALNKKQKELLQLASEYATPDSTLQYINCVYVLKKQAVLASNRISIFYGVDQQLPISLPLPILLLKVIDRETVKSIEVAKSLIKLVLKNGYLCQSLNSVAVKEFPVKQSLNQFKLGNSYPLQFKVKATSFLKAIKRLEMYVSGSGSREILVTVKGIKGESKLLLSCDTLQSKFTEIVNTLHPIKFDIQCNWLLLSLVPLDSYKNKLGVLEFRWEDRTKSPYHIFSKYGISLMLARKVK